MSKNDFYEILNKIKTENLFSSQAVELFSSCVGGKFEVELSFLQFTSVFGRQLDSKYDNGFKFDCVTNDQQEVIVLFPEGCKELVEELRDEKSHALTPRARYLTSCHSSLNDFPPLFIKIKSA